jgi:probable phosphoglycerate mutase
MRFYFVRHGESEANVSKQFSNKMHELHPLTARGREQAEKLAGTLRAIKFNAIYASPLLRARQTAEIVNQHHGLAIQVTLALSEHDAGDFEGRADDAAWEEYSQLFERWILRHELDARIPNGESFNEMRARFIPFIADVTQKYADSDTNILFVGHAGIFHSMLPLLLSNVGYAFGSQHILGNTGVIVVEQQKGDLVCLEWDTVRLSPTGEHLGEI